MNCFNDQPHANMLLSSVASTLTTLEIIVSSNAKMPNTFFPCLKKLRIQHASQDMSWIDAPQLTTLFLDTFLPTSIFSVKWYIKIFQGFSLPNVQNLCLFHINNNIVHPSILSLPLKSLWLTHCSVIFDNAIQLIQSFPDLTEVSI